jgi:phosphatidylserine/phosphatidylglycerophosphate/cardiolipin synthase-like enzyme
VAGIDELRTRYFADASDLKIQGESVPATSNGNRVEFFIDSDAYFGALRAELAGLALGGSTNPFFYFADWYLGLVSGPSGKVTGGEGSTAWQQDATATPVSPFKLDDGSGTAFPDFVDELDLLSQNGVDVRCIAWVSPFVLQYKAIADQTGYWSINMQTLLSIQELRKRHGMLHKAILNTIAHPFGAMHLKVVVLGNDSILHAYTSGLDFVANRVAGWRHLQTGGKNQWWHDAAARVRGPAAQTIYEWLSTVWEEQVKSKPLTFNVNNTKIDSHDSTLTRSLPKRVAPPISAPSTHHVQVLRTSPQMRFATKGTSAAPVGCMERTSSGFRKDPMSFAKDGIFEFRLALRKAISGAQQYIYMEDQGFYSLEIMDWINARLQEPEGQDLKVILLFGRDVADPDNTVIFESINNHLLKGLPDLSRIVFYEYKRLIVHAKIAIIDDQWASMGSANAYRRSLYTDFECSVAVLDETQPLTFAQQLRKELWGEHCYNGMIGADGVWWNDWQLYAPGAARDPLLDLSKALGIWNSAWGARPPFFWLRPPIQRMDLPFQVCDLGTGTISLTKDSDIAVGAGTSWDSSLAGKSLKAAGGRIVVVQSVTSPTVLTLAAKYPGDSLTDQPYRVQQYGRWLMDSIPTFDPLRADQLDADSRKEY